MGTHSCIRTCKEESSPNSHKGSSQVRVSQLETLNHLELGENLEESRNWLRASLIRFVLYWIRLKKQVTRSELLFFHVWWFDFNLSLLETQISKPKQQLVIGYAKKTQNPRILKDMASNHTRYTKRGIITLVRDSNGPHMRAKYGPTMKHGGWTKIATDLWVWSFFRVCILIWVFPL